MYAQEEIDLFRLLKIIQRRYPVILLCVLTLTLLAFAYLILEKPKFTASSMLFLDRSVTSSVSDISAVKQMVFEKDSIESEVEVLRSREVTKTTLNKLLTMGYFPEIKDQTKSQEDVIEELIKNLDVSRVGETYILSVKYTDEDPKKAADIANTFAQSYIDQQLTTLSDMSSRMMTWLQSQITNIGENVISSEQRLLDYRAQFNKTQRDEDSEETKNSLAKLNQLEKEKETYSNLYESYLERLETITSQQTLPITEARIITYATAPKSKSHPNNKIILGLAIIFGTGLGFLLILLIENYDKSLRRAGQVTREIGTPFLGFFPERRKSKAQRITFTSPAKVNHDISIHVDSLVEPQSLKSETIRAIHYGLEQKAEGHSTKVIGVVSVKTNPGQIDISSNLAAHLGQFSSALLIDSQNLKTSFIRNNSKSEPDLISVFTNKAPLQNAVLKEASHNLALLTSMNPNIKQMITHAGIKDFKNFIDLCRAEYEYIIIDLPPLDAGPHAYSYAKAIDFFVIVAEWGKTLPNDLNFNLKKNNLKTDDLLGLVLENMDTRKMRKYYARKV